MWLLVDGNSVGWAVWYALPNEVRESDDFNLYTGIWRHAFLTKLVKLAKKLGNGKAVYTVVVWDGRFGASIRRRIFKEYKSKRREKYKVAEGEKDVKVTRYFDAVNEFVNRVRDTDTCRKLGVRFDQLEADDVISAICKVLESEEVVIYSSDMDLWQLLRYSNTKLISPRNDKEFNRNAVKRKLGIEPDYVWVYKAVVGDPSDGWSGIRGLGDKKFKKMIEEKSITEAMEEWKNFPEFRIGEKLCKLPSEWMLEKEFGKDWSSRAKRLITKWKRVKIDPPEVVISLDLRKLSTADLQYLM